MTDFDNPPDQFTRKLAEVKQRQPLRIISVAIGAEGALAQASSDHVICVDDLLRDRKQRRSPVGDASAYPLDAASLSDGQCDHEIT